MLEVFGPLLLVSSAVYCARCLTDINVMMIECHMNVDLKTDGLLDKNLFCNYPEGIL